MWPRRLECLWLIWIYYTLFSYISSGSRCIHFTKSSHQSLFKREKTLKTMIFRLLFLSKNGEVRSKKWSDCNKFGMSRSCSVTYFPKVGECFSLKIPTKENFEATFLKQKLRSATKKFEMFLIKFASLYLVQLHVFWK